MTALHVPYVEDLLKLDALPQIPTGSIKLRPVAVIDSTGRSISFSYYGSYSSDGGASPDFGGGAVA